MRNRDRNTMTMFSQVVSEYSCKDQGCPPRVTRWLIFRSLHNSRRFHRHCWSFRSKSMDLPGCIWQLDVTRHVHELNTTRNVGKRIDFSACFLNSFPQLSNLSSFELFLEEKNTLYCCFYLNPYVIHFIKWKSAYVIQSTYVYFEFNSHLGAG